MATRAHSLFQQNIGYARSLLGLATAISASTSSALDVSDLLRAGLVQGVSALDHYVHGVARDGMMETFRGARTPTLSYETFAIPMSVVAVALSAPPSDAWLEGEIVRQHALRSFQKSEKVADGLRLITATPIWPRVASTLHVPAVDLKRQLDLIVDRRNKMVHEADADPSAPGARWPITPADVTSSIDYIERVVGAIDGLL